MTESSSTKNILLVDDDENTRIMCQRELSKEGYITSSVSSGPEALQFLNKNPQVDLVILDVEMVPLNGIQVLKQLRAKMVKTPVIIYSGYSHYKNNFTTWLADAYVVKSSDLTELKEKVKEFLTREERIR